MLKSPFYMFHLLFRVQLNDQLLLDILGDICAVGTVQQLTGLLALIPLQPGILGVVKTCQSSSNHLQRLGTLTHADNLAGLYCVRGNTYHFAVNGDVLVVDELTGSSTSGSDAQTEHDVVKTALQVLQQDLPVIPLVRAAFSNMLRNCFSRTP